MIQIQKIKDPDAVLDYQFNWTSWLQSGETVSSYTLILSSTAEGAIEVDSDEELNGVVTAWLSGGQAGTHYYITCRIETDQGRTDDRTMKIFCDNR